MFSLLYIHIPFCLRKCPYCAFKSETYDRSQEGIYCDAVVKEIGSYAKDPNWQGKFKSIYFGGGTPSLLSKCNVQRIIDAARESFDFVPNTEITLEANPKTLDKDKLLHYKKCGINRLSIGTQSFIDENLKILGRIHSAQDAIDAFNDARYFGFNNISIDLMYGLPKQKLESVNKDLEKILTLNPEHVSLYILSLEDGTSFDLKYSKKHLPKENDIISMDTLVQEKLRYNGYNQYEISNFSKKGYESKHNMGYWDFNNYLGVGAAAHSFCVSDNNYTNGLRWYNEESLKDYVTAVFDKGNGIAKSMVSTKDNLIFEYLIVGLRKVAGIDLNDFQNKFQVSIYDIYKKQLDLLMEKKLIEEDLSMLKLTDKGRQLTDSVLELFLFES